MDVDFDFPTTFKPLEIFPEAVRASLIKGGELAPHPCGHYLQKMAVDPFTNLAAIAYEDAESLGFFKIDFLHLSILDKVQSKEELRAMARAAPDWSLLLDPVCCSKLFQLSKHSELLLAVRPKDTETLADCVALIRPSKSYLKSKYIGTTGDKTAIRRELYSKPSDDKSWFKKAHAIAYALTIVVQLHLYEQSRL